MPTVIDRLNADHVNMTRLLDILDQQFDLIEQAGNANFEIMRDAMHYLVHYSDAIHHPMEDLMYARLAERSPKARKDLMRIPEQHDAIEAKSRHLHEAVSMVADGGMTERVQILEAGRDYLANMRKHIEMEEQYLFPLAVTLLDDRDLEEVEKIFEENQDPVFGTVVSNDYSDLYRHIQEQVT